MWLNELDELKKQYVEYKEERLLLNGISKQKVVSKTRVTKISKKKILIVEDV